MDKNYYRKYYDYERTHWWFITRNTLLMKIIEKNIPVTSQLKILNVGAGTGFTSELLGRYGTVTSIEYEQSCVELVNEKTNLHLIEGSILNLQYGDNTFDLVCAFDVIEHVEDDTKAVSEIIRVAKKDGHVFVSVPAFNSLWSRHDEINHHFRRYKQEQVLSLFKQRNNLQSIYYTYFNFFLFIPIYFARKSAGIIRKLKGTKIPQSTQLSTDFDIAGKGFLSALLKWIFSIEIPVVEKKQKLPFGVSFTLLAKKI